MAYGSRELEDCHPAVAGRDAHGVVRRAVVEKHDVLDPKPEVVLDVLVEVEFAVANDGDNNHLIRIAGDVRRSMDVANVRPQADGPDPPVHHRPHDPPREPAQIPARPAQRRLGGQAARQSRASTDETR